MAKLLKEYVAKPVLVQAGVITEVHSHDANHMKVVLDNGDEKLVNLGMTSRMQPVIGDYYVIQEDGYVYLNPKAVFERKYGPKELDPKNAQEFPAIAQETLLKEGAAEDPANHDDDGKDEKKEPVVTQSKLVKMKK